MHTKADGFPVCVSLNNAGRDFGCDRGRQEMAVDALLGHGMEGGAHLPLSELPLISPCDTATWTCMGHAETNAQFL